MSVAIFDFDDMRQDENALDYLFRMKARWPGFKVTLFTIPMQCSRSFLSAVSEIDWIQLAVHGWEHKKCECETWDFDTALTYLKTVEEWKNSKGDAVFVRGFKAPNWRLKQPTVDALVAREGYWLADNPDPASNPHGVVVPDTLPRYFFSSNDFAIGMNASRYHREHGHIGCLDCHNDIRQTFHHLMDKYPEDQEFAFIDDVMADHHPIL